MRDQGIIITYSDNNYNDLSSGRIQHRGQTIFKVKLFSFHLFLFPYSFHLSETLKKFPFSADVIMSLAHVTSLTEGPPILGYST